MGPMVNNSDNFIINVNFDLPIYGNNFLELMLRKDLCHRFKNNSNGILT